MASRVTETFEEFSVFLKDFYIRLLAEEEMRICEERIGCQKRAEAREGEGRGDGGMEVVDGGKRRRKRSKAKVV